MKLTVFGASRPLGRQLVDQAVERGHEVTAVVQPTAPDQGFGDSVETVEVDVYDGTNVESALDGSTVVCNVLQHGPSAPTDFLSVSGRNILNAMESVGCSRYLTVAPAAAQRDGEQRGIVESIAVSLLRLRRPTVTADAIAHVDEVTGRDLNWTVIRVLRSAEGETTRQYKTGDLKLGVKSVSYGDLAAFLLDCCERGIYVRMLPKIRT